MPLLRLATCVALCILGTLTIQAQIDANPTSGCAPLTGVQFTNSYAGATNIGWDFDDGASASIANPTHSFVSPGTYNVEFAAIVGGQPVTDNIVIQVFGSPSPDFDITSASSGCVGMTVDFEDNSTGGGGVPIVDWEWAFGDGGVSNTADNSPSYQYNLVGVFDVSLIVTDANGCDSAITVVDAITVSSPPNVQVNVNPFPPTSCNPPLDVTFNSNCSSNSPLGDDLDYSWVFGNGQTSSVASPGTITYVDPEVYNVVLTVTDDVGCSQTWTTNVSLSQPHADFTVLGAENDTICLDAFVENNSVVTPFYWNYGDGTGNTIQQEHVFPGEGWYDIYFHVGSGGCTDDTTITVFVEVPTATITSFPNYSCSIPFTVDYEAESDYNVESWDWLFSYQGTASGQDVSNTYDFADTSYYAIDGLTPLTTYLTITTVNGCSALIPYTGDTLHQPNALFYPQTTEGCAPLEIIFSDSSTTHVTEPMVTYEWHLGDGTVITNTDDSEVTYTYTEPGNYDTFLIVENSVGCIDTSWIHTIHVGVPPDPNFTFEPSSACPGEPVQIINTTNPADSVDTWNFMGDGFMLFACQDDGEPVLSFSSEAGMVPVTITAGYNGCYSTSIELFELLGPVGRVRYTCNCDTPLDYEFTADVSGADHWTWDFGDGTIITNSNDVFMPHSYTESGDFWTVLTSYNESSGCDPFVDSLLVHVRQLEAIIELSNDGCLGDEYVISAASSVDVLAECFRGYTFYFGDDIPPVVGENSSVSYEWDELGIHEIELWVQDINGCADSTVFEIEIHTIQAGIDSDVDFGCIPLDVQFFDASVSDTTIVSWEWVFGNGDLSDEQNPFYTYEEVTYNGQGFPFDFFVDLTVVDAYGCEGVIEDYVIDPFSPNAAFVATTDATICVGTDVAFSPTYADEDGNTFLWTFGPNQTSEEYEPSYTYNDPGEFEVTLTIVDELGCIGALTQSVVSVQAYPIAGFYSSGDTLETLCYPALVTFTDTSIISPFGSRTWDLGNGDPVIGNVTVGTTYELPGTYEVDLSVSTTYGCTDATTMVIEVEGPLANFALSDNLICKGETITLSMIDTVDVWTWQWDFGDGTDSSAVNPIEHTYNFHPPGGQTQATLIVWSTDSVCSAAINQTLNIEQVIADFDRNNEIAAQDTVHCEGIPDLFTNNSVNADQWEWNFGNGDTYSGQNPPNITYEPGTWDITLFIQNSELGCVDTITKQMIIYPLPDVVVNDAVICLGESTLLTAEGANEYQWSPTTYLDDPTGNPVTATPLQSVVYEVLGSDTNGCENTAFADVFVFQPPPEIIWDTTIVIGEIVNLDAFAGEGYDYIWDPDLWLSCDTCAQVSSIPLEDIEYTVTVTDSLGCFSVVSYYTIEVLPVSSIDVPDAFTPNGDGVNDIIYVDGWGIKELLEFKIYNRWGELVFETSNLEEGWDGYYKEELQNVETYAYVVVAMTFIDPEPVTKKGYINLLR